MSFCPFFSLRVSRILYKSKKSGQRTKSLTKKAEVWHTFDVIRCLDLFLLLYHRKDGYVLCKAISLSMKIKVWKTELCTTGLNLASAVTTPITSPPQKKEILFFLVGLSSRKGKTNCIPLSLSI